MVTRTLLPIALCVAVSHAGAQGVGSWDIAPQVMTTLAASTPNSVFGGQATGISQTAIAVRASTELLQLGRVHLRYSAQLLPFISLRGVEQYSQLDVTGGRLYVINGRTNAVGFGLTPLGLDLAVDVTTRVRLQAGAAAGVTRFSQHVPFAAGRQRNFSAEWDGTLLVDAGRDRWVQLGIRWKHLSNGFTAYENPGIDNKMLFAGMSMRVHAKR